MDDTVSIVQFLQRPIKLDHFQLTPINNPKPLNKATFGTKQPTVKQYDLPYDILSKGGKLEKANNHQYFKADIKVKIVLNANPFISGRFWLTYSPYEDTVVGARRQIYASRAGVTAYPGVEIDAQLDNTVEMLIPYASYKEAYVLTDKPENFVKMSIFPLTPVLGPTTGSAAVIDMAIYAWFENVTINIPTCKLLTEPRKVQEIASISKLDKERLRTARKIEKLEKDNPSIYQYIQQFINPKPKNTNLRKTREVGFDIPDSLGVTQRIMANMQVQAEDTSSGPISGIASIVGGIADAASAIPIPIVKEVAGGISWLANIVGNIASIFGWSRPTHMGRNQEFANVPAKNYTHVEAIDNGVNLSLSNRNELDKAFQIFPSAADEMDLAYCCANPALKEVFTWSVAGEGEMNLRTIGLMPVGIGPFDRIPDTNQGQLCPGPEATINKSSSPYVWRQLELNRPEVLGSAQESVTFTPYARVGDAIMDTAPCEYISQLFTFWRATICFKISVVKTAFHTGRLEIFFDPGPYFNSGPNPDLDRYNEPLDTTNNYKYILDLTNDTEVTIRIPYVSEKLFKRTIGANTRANRTNQTVVNPEDIFDSMIGSLVIRPISNLLAPETVSDTVHILVWKWAEDVVFGVPKQATQGNLKIHDGSKAGTGTACPGNLPHVAADFVLSNTYGNENCRNTNKIAVDIQINIGNKADGNVVTFFETTNVEQENMNACKNSLGERIVSLRPLLRCFRNITTGNITHQKPLEHDFQKDMMWDANFFTDYVSYLSYMYRFFRGGNRIKYVVTKIKPVEGVVPHITSNIKHQGVNEPSTGPSHLTFPQVNPVHEVTIPYYAQYRKLPISPVRSDEEKDIREDENIMNLELRSNSEIEGYLMRSGNDDLTYGWLMGTPQLAVGTNSISYESFCVTKRDGIPSQ